MCAALVWASLLGATLLRTTVLRVCLVSATKMKLKDVKHDGAIVPRNACDEELIVTENSDVFGMDYCNSKEFQSTTCPSSAGYA